MSVSKIGRFEIISEIAHSEYSSVYRATDSATNRPVALKTFNLDLAGDDRPNLVKRLIQEAESTRNLTHQNIVLLFGAGEIDGRFCVATEYVEGFSIAANIAQGERYTVWDMLDISRQACNGLDHAHNHGVVHRRLHPANVLVMWDGTVKILGFGITGMWTEEDAQGVLSPASYYASPEQVRGQSLHTRSNLFSWGVILYEMATGKKPFDGSDVGSLRQQILDFTPVAPIELNPKITPNLSALILKAMSKVPTDRFANGRELLGALENCKEAPKQAATIQGPRKTATPRPIPVVAQAPPAAPKAAAASASPFATKLERTSNGDTSEDENFDDDMLLDASGRATATSSAVKKAEPAKAAAAGAQVGRASSAPTAASTSPAPAPSKFNIDPMMAAAAASEASAPPRSWADAELPPLAAPAPDQFAPAAPVAPAPEAPATPGATLFTAPEVEEKKKFALPQIESKLLIHGLIGGLAIVLLGVGIIALYVHFHTSDDEGAVPAPIVAAKTEETPAEPAPAPVAVPNHPVEAASAPEETADEGSSAKSNARKTKVFAKAPVAAATASGMVAVDSSPQGAQIQVDGRFDSTWVTPFTVAQLTPGQHNVVISKPGYGAETRVLNVSSGSKNTLSIHLTPLLAMISVTSDPSGASVLLDGRETGKLTPAQVNLEKGPHTVLVRKTGFLDETMTAEGQPGQTIGFAPHLRPLGSTDEIREVNKIKKLFGGKDLQPGMGAVAIHTTPKGAQISVNQRVLDHLSPTEFLLNPGNYVVDITATGYRPLRRVITVEKNGRMTIDENLERE